MAPNYIANAAVFHKIYVANTDNNTVSVIDGSNYKKHDIIVGDRPGYIALGGHDMIYVANLYDNTVSVIDGKNNKEIIC